MQLEVFDEFILMRAAEMDAVEAQNCAQAFTELAAKSHQLIYFDLGVNKIIDSENLKILSRSIALCKTDHFMEVLLICEPELAKQIRASGLGQVTQLFSREDNPARRQNTVRILAENQTELNSRLEKTLDGAIQNALARWTGKQPQQIIAAIAEVNPATHVVSSVEMTIDGSSFRVFLSGSLKTLRGMVAQILHEDISEGDPAILDGACELLNYMTAFFKQKLISDESVVEASPPQLLDPEQMMLILDQNWPAQRVFTDHGTFDVWFEAAA